MAELQNTPPRFVTRFAPSPTGLLHLGHAFSAMVAFDAAAEKNGTCLLRIEDADAARVRPEYEAAIYEDLAWLGFSWPKPALRQSERHDAYAEALEALGRLGVLYPCRCTRADIRAALSAPQEGADGVVNAPTVYPGTCRHRSLKEAGPKDALRLDLNRAFSVLDGQDLVWEETGALRPGHHRLDENEMRRTIGDVVLARKDIGAAAYHLSVVVDDAHQGITHVVRGEDLLDQTPIHRLLQALLGLPVPAWHHHGLVRDETGKRLAKRDDARSIRTFREASMTPDNVRKLSIAQAK